MSFHFVQQNNILSHPAPRVMGGGSLVELKPIVRRVVGLTLALAAMGRDLGQVLRSQLPVALRRETPTQYPCCVWSASE